MKTVAQNRRAKFDYDILETLEAGMMLTGPEVKSCRLGHVSLMGSYLSFQNSIPVIKKLKISKYGPAATLAHDEERDRVLLLKKAEQEKLMRFVSEKGIAIVPIEIRVGRYVKVLLAVGRGRKKLDKRARIKERETARDLRKGNDR